MRNKLKVFSLVFLMSYFYLSFVWADDVPHVVPDPGKGKMAKAEKSLWKTNLDAGFNFAFSQSSGVIGVQDGTTLNLGLQLNGSFKFSSTPHVWETTFSFILTETKLPTIEPFIKSADKFELETIYSLSLPKITWFSFFASLRLEASLLPGFLVRDKDSKLVLTEPDGTKTNLKPIKAQEIFDLTKAFSPLLFKQSLGASFIPLEKPYMNIYLKLGVGFTEAWTQNGIRVDDNADTEDTVELARLQDYVQGGGELRIRIDGVILNKMLNYSLTSNVMVPFFTNIETKLTLPELINFDLNLKIGIKLFKWMSLNYALSLIRVPLIQPKLQVINNIVLSLSWNILS